MLQETVGPAEPAACLCDVSRAPRWNVSQNAHRAARRGSPPRHAAGAAAAPVGRPPRRAGPRSPATPKSWAARARSCRPRQRCVGIQPLQPPGSLAAVHQRTLRAHRSLAQPAPGPHSSVVLRDPSMSVSVSVHQPALDSTSGDRLDWTPDLRCTDSTRAHWVDVEHQPTELVASAGRVGRGVSGVVGRLLERASWGCPTAGSGCPRDRRCWRTARSGRPADRA